MKDKYFTNCCALRGRVVKKLFNMIEEGNNNGQV